MKKRVVQHIHLGLHIILPLQLQHLRRLYSCHLKRIQASFEFSMFCQSLERIFLIFL